LHPPFVHLGDGGATKATDAATTRALVTLLRSEAAQDVLKRKGMDLPRNRVLGVPDAGKLRRQPRVQATKARCTSCEGGPTRGWLQRFSF
jgi:hypothetical protein